MNEELQNILRNRLEFNKNLVERHSDEIIYQAKMIAESIKNYCDYSCNHQKFIAFCVYLWKYFTKHILLFDNF